MNSFKLLIVFILLLLGSFAQRFQRHLINGTQNGYINGESEMESLDALSSDGEIYEQEGDNVKFVSDGKEVELELETLKFKFCSDGCMGKTVIACYDSPNPNSNAKGECGPGQCEFKAGISEGDDKKPFLWFYDKFHNKFFPKNGDVCQSATMEFPETKTTGIPPFPSCEPLKHDGNVVKLYIQRVPHGCLFYVLNAKKWTPPPSTTTTTKTIENNQTTPKSSNAELWIGIGIVIFIIFVIIIGFGYCCYRTQIQKKPLFGNKKEVVKEKTEDKQEIVIKPESKKEEKQQPKPTKEKKAIVATKPSKEVTQENTTKEDVPPAKKVSVERTLEDPPTKSSVVLKLQHSRKPRVYVPKQVILPAPKSSSKNDSLSGQHEVVMQILVENSSESVKRHCFDLLNEDANEGVIEKLENFYPPGPVRAFERREIELFCCARISIMFKLIETLVDVAIKALSENGATFDEHSNITEMNFRAEKYLQSSSTPEFIRSFAFGSIFREFIDSEAKNYKTFSIPLLFSVALQRRYTVFNRRKACTLIRRQLPIIQKEFSEKERSMLAFPICAIEEACKMDAYGFKNVSSLDSLSGAEDVGTQHSSHASEKLRKKESAGGKKKRSKKRR